MRTWKTSPSAGQLFSNTIRTKHTNLFEIYEIDEGSLRLHIDGRFFNKTLKTWKTLRFYKTSPSAGNECFLEREIYTEHTILFEI